MYHTYAQHKSDHNVRQITFRRGLAALIAFQTQCILCVFIPSINMLWCPSWSFISGGKKLTEQSQAKPASVWGVSDEMSAGESVHTFMSHFHWNRVKHMQPGTHGEIPSYQLEPPPPPPNLPTWTSSSLITTPRVLQHSKFSRAPGVWT